MTDTEFLLRVLEDGGWHSLNSILQRSFAERGCGLTVHSRASDLRARGYLVEHRMMGRRGEGSMYRLVGVDGGGPRNVYPGLASQSVNQAASVSVVGHNPSTGKDADGDAQPSLFPDAPERRGAYWQAA